MQRTAKGESDNTFKLKWEQKGAKRAQISMISQLRDRSAALKQEEALELQNNVQQTSALNRR